MSIDTVNIPTRRAVARLMATVPEVRSPGLRPAQRRLLALALAVTRAPSWARIPQFEMAVAALDRMASGGATWASPSPSVGPSDPTAAQTAGRPPIGAMAPAPVEPPLPPGFRATEAAGVVAGGWTDTPRLEVAAAAADSGRGDGPRMRTPRVREPKAEIRHLMPDAMPGSVARAATPANTPADPERPNEPSRPVSAAPPRPDAEPIAVATRVETEYGGVFYLLNAWIAMGLYGDFTAPRARNLTLSPWDLLALVGRAWFRAPFVSDPVWDLLADLAARDPEDEPGRDVDMPEAWLDEHLEVLHARLQLALGGGEAVDLTGIVCRHHARIEQTSSTLHLHLALGELPLSLRIAGLDRDPGWIPAAGRAVYFHFS
jgi:hypothetical protein